jgi:glycosyltransferase involved in cell wall biosynthesis
MQPVTIIPIQQVTVIATVLNEVKEISRLVPTLLAQVPPPAEVIIVDGGSTDGTWDWLLEAQRENPILLAIRDESCNLKRSPGPISRGRNVAITAARSQIIACTDAGCTYAPDWLAHITAPLLDYTAEYALGGSCLDPADPTVWDLASAPFFGVKLLPSTPSKSCTARSMAFRKNLWNRIGGFPETVFFGEDTLFDLEARRLTPAAFVEGAKALYRPQYSFVTAFNQLASYAVSDGILSVRRARLVRNAARCVVEVLALLCLLLIRVPAVRSSTEWWWAVLPFLAVLLLQFWYAFHPDWRYLYRKGPRVLLARFFFSILVPWIVAAYHIQGMRTKLNQPNRQNL